MAGFQRAAQRFIPCAAVVLLLLFSQALKHKWQENRHKRRILDSTETPAEHIDPAAVDLTPLVNALINSSQSGSRQLFSLLSVTSYSSLALHKLTLLVYNISSIKNVESNMFRRRFCYCVTNDTNDLTDFTAILLDVMGNSTSHLHELFKSSSILSVSQRNNSDCIYICVMAGKMGREVPELWDFNAVPPLFNQTIIEGPHRGLSITQILVPGNISSFRLPVERHQLHTNLSHVSPSGTSSLLTSRVQSAADESPTVQHETAPTATVTPARPLATAQQATAQQATAGRSPKQTETTRRWTPPTVTAALQPIPTSGQPPSTLPASAVGRPAEPPGGPPTAPPREPPIAPHDEPPGGAPTEPPEGPPKAPPTSPPTEPPTAPHEEPPEGLPTEPPEGPPKAPPTSPPTEPPTAPHEEPPEGLPTEPPKAPPTSPPREPPTAPHEEPPEGLPTEPPTSPPREPPTAPHEEPPEGLPTEPPKAPPTSPPREPPTAPHEEPPEGLPTEPPTSPPREPPIAPPTVSPAEPPGGPTMEPPTESPEGRSMAPPGEPPTAPPTVPPTLLPTEPPTESPIAPPTAPPTEPPTVPPRPATLPPVVSLTRLNSDSQPTRLVTVPQRTTGAVSGGTTIPSRPEETEKPGCPWRRPERSSPGFSPSATTVGAHKLQPCVLELCKFFSQCLCRPSVHKTRMRRYCDDSHLWYERHTSELCRRVRRISFSRNLKQRCLTKMCSKL